MSNNLHPTAPITTTTNFDLTSLHMLRPEIVTTLQNAEMHLSEFNDDSSQAPLLLDAVETMGQVARILQLITLEESAMLAQAIADSIQKLYDEDSQDNGELLMTISEGIMMLNRYIEFVLLKETLEPSLILPIINHLREQIGQHALTVEQITVSKTRSLVIANPENNFQSLRKLGITNQALVKAYRAGLKVALSATEVPTHHADLGKLKAMQAACETISRQADSLFWQAADAAVSDLAKVLPLSHSQKRALIFVEQQFNDYLPINDSRFADLVRFASTRDSVLASKVQQQFAINGLNAAQLAEMRRFLFGPNQEITETLNNLIQEEIEVIKTASDDYARQDTMTSSEDNRKLMIERLHNLSAVFKTLSLPQVSDVLTQQLAKVQRWPQQPTPEDFDELLTSLIVAENASIHLAKSQTPGAKSFMIHDANISLHQLDTAYSTLITESRLSVANIETAINDYLADDQHDVMNLINVPEMMQNIAGACTFLNLTSSSQLLKRASAHLSELVNNHPEAIDVQTLANLADVIMAVDHYLEGRELNKPPSRYAYQIAQKSLHELIAA